MKTLSLPGKAASRLRKSRRKFRRRRSRSPWPAGRSGIVGLGGEIFNEIGREIKKGSPFSMTLVMTHCNGSAGYMPTRASYPEGGYEVRGTRFAPGADEKVVEEAVRMLKELQ